MSSLYLQTKNTTIRFLYKNILKKIFFLRDPEAVHDHMTQMGIFLGSNGFTRFLTKKLFFFEDKSLHQHIHGIEFKNPVGLSAGFDKDALLPNILPEVGFGFEEVGSITGEPCVGNPKPRLWRIPRSQSLIVYYGLKNEGCEKIKQRLEGKKFRFPLGISIAKTNCADTADTQKGITDYVKAYRVMSSVGDYDTINISCPNAFGGQPFTDKIRLDSLLTELNKYRSKKPMFIKLSPDLSLSELDDILELAKKHQVNGVVCSNLTKRRDNAKIQETELPENGGLSGKVVEDLANQQIAYIYKKTEGKLTIIGVGGIFSAADAYKKIRLGASLVQLITGMIFEGPQLIGDINFGLTQLLKKDGFKNISEAIGKDNI